MVGASADQVLHWRCPACALEWRDAGRGFPGHRFSECLRCGTQAREGVDARPSTGRRFGPALRVTRVRAADHEAPAARAHR